MWGPSSCPRVLRQEEFCPPSRQPSMDKAKYTVTLWPEAVGTGRPGPAALDRPNELFWGTFIDGT